MAEEWRSWLALAGVGGVYGLNPALGWVFSWGVGLPSPGRGVGFLSLVPIALGHALSVALVGAAFVLAGLTVNAQALGLACSLLLIGWGLYHWGYRHRHRVRFGMQTGLAGILLWSFLVATAHGAGPMLLPIFIAGAFPS